MPVPQAPMIPLPEPQSTEHFVTIHAFETGYMRCRQSVFIDGLLGDANVGSWRFFISHAPSNTKLWFDLGMSNDLTDYPPSIQERHQKFFDAKPAQNTLRDDLKALNVKGSDVGFVVASHAHWDHMFPAKQYLPNATVLCGPGTLSLTQDTWPSKEDSEYDGRIWNPQRADLPIRELPSQLSAPEQYWCRVGPFDKGHDFFGDGSFYLIDSPGHMSGNLSALCRTQTHTGELRWVLLAGDCIHSPHFVQHPEAPFGCHLPTPSGCIHSDPALARDTIRRISALKTGDTRVLVWLAHADSLEGQWEFDLPLGSSASKGVKGWGTV
ncbi:beta-lactamase-like protein [Aspergillus pseudoustus]|uniref:Beta-lactamase-like protein n=1 Tax=Aspergillus pseudoustus TaxID=1810923 RepID=A0ABR4J0K5_9EURO